MQSVLSWFTAALAATRPSKPTAPPILSFFVFGDSYTDTGFRTTYSFPTLSQPFGYPPLGTDPSQSFLDGPLVSANTSAKGPVWPQYLTTRYNTTQTLTYNFAIGGANIPDSCAEQVQHLYQPRFSSLYSSHNSQKSSPSPPSSPDHSNAKPGTPWNSTTSLFALWIGINDINDCGLIFHPHRRQSMRKCLAPRFEETLTGLLRELHRTGARRFLLLNLPPLERTPLVRSVGGRAVGDYKEGVRFVNQVLLPGVVKGVERELGGEVWVYDVFGLFEQVLDDPRKYGFTDDRCEVGKEGDEGKECIWSDWFHPATKFHELMAREIRDLFDGGQNQVDL